MSRPACASDVVWAATYLPKGFPVPLRYWIARALVFGALVSSSAVAAGWKWSAGF
jgi:hypothetical protein